MGNVEIYVDRLIQEIKDGAVYRQYTIALEKLNENPELKRQVDELRRLNYQVQAESDAINLYDAIDDIDSRIDKLSCVPEVTQFLESELALCRQLQSVEVRLHQGINLNIPDLF
ncbi:MAG: YlbF family regulator [Blautia sp.]